MFVSKPFQEKQIQASESIQGYKTGKHLKIPSKTETFTFDKFSEISKYLL